MCNDSMSGEWACCVDCLSLVRVSSDECDVMDAMDVRVDE